MLVLKNGRQMKCRYQREAGSVGTCDTVQKVGEKKQSFGGEIEVEDELAFARGRGRGERRIRREINAAGQGVQGEKQIAGEGGGG